MSGGGEMGGVAARHGFNLGCSTNSVHHSLEVNWAGGNNFHLDSILFVDCYMNTNLKPANPSPPAANFNTLFLTVLGEFNGQLGTAVTLTFTDQLELGPDHPA